MVKPLILAKLTFLVKYSNRRSGVTNDDRAG